MEQCVVEIVGIDISGTDSGAEFWCCAKPAGAGNGGKKLGGQREEENTHQQK